MHLPLAVLPLLAATSVAKVHHPRREPCAKLLDRDVCIIGGGSSGTYAAVQLAEKGHSVAVIERQDHLGGHAVTYTDPDTGKPINMGVILFHDIPIVRDYFGLLGVELGPADASGGAITQYFDFTTGAAVPGFELPDQETLGAALAKYGTILQERYPDISLAYNLPDPVPEELVRPYAEFIEEHGLQAIVNLVNSIAGGNGNLWERPALFGIKVFSPMLLAAFNKGFINAASGDNRDLYRAAEKRLGDDNVILSSTVTKVERNSKGVKVTVDTPEGKVTCKGKKLLVAIPPTTESLKTIKIKLTEGESRLFRQFKGVLYGSAVVTNAGFNDSTALSNIGTDNPYNLMSLPGTYSYSGESGTNKVRAYYGGTESNIGLTEEEIKALITGELDNLERAGTIGEGDTEFVFFVNHSPYHVHVDSETVAGGFYKELYEVEGKTNTFWTGAAFVDQDSSLIWSWSEEYLVPLIVDSLKK
ncbi:related to amine oxidase, flavin-containing superfamily [Cephalotrichum gorgonifer]|uniref:Related to amine oxidase, flavin-containing superfamily n=1 Tax=Cephalotrichum gorgonifer TaxID=2041049 RepID=A0AAE8N637_9PEZI|nr:related to amine oxidase, flavin-containing superfamily [Cephalotrichum gorgonifer]